jgi:hypothetical protein
MGVPDINPLSELSLPPGFRFFPTDEELLVQYLCRKVAGHHFSMQIIGEIDLYKFDPWVLPGKALFGEKEWYFFSPRDRKYPNGSRPNRVAGSGYWKATGTDKMITKDGVKVGIKKALVFYIGKAPKGTKTNWIMHEYRLSEPQRNNHRSAKLDEWVLCRIYKKHSTAEKCVTDDPTKEYSRNSSSSSSSQSQSQSQFDDVMDSLPEIERLNSLRTLLEDEKQDFQSLGSGNFDWATVAALGMLPEKKESQAPVINNHNHNRGQNDVFGMKVEDEVESGPINGRVENSGFGFFQHNPNAYTQSFSNSVDQFQFGIGYPTQKDNFLGFRR